MRHIILSKKDRSAWLKVISGICSNVAASWIAFAVIAPGISFVLTVENVWLLTRSILFAIVFTWFAFLFERKVK